MANKSLDALMDDARSGLHTLVYKRREAAKIPRRTLVTGTHGAYRTDGDMIHGVVLTFTEITIAEWAAHQTREAQ